MTHTSLRDLHEGASSTGDRFRYALLAFDLRPAKAHFRCPTCGLKRHDHDAVHCKACGTVLNIPDDGLD